MLLLMITICKGSSTRYVLESLANSAQFSSEDRQQTYCTELQDAGPDLVVISPQWVQHHILTHILYCNQFMVPVWRAHSASLWIIACKVVTSGNCSPSVVCASGCNEL
jgi:hypothetical protein